MNHWSEQLQVAALLGTARAPVPQPPAELPEALRTLAATQPGLLPQLALATVWQRAGWQPVRQAAPTSRQTDEPEAVAWASGTARQLLVQALAREGQQWLDTWLEHAAKAGVLVPPALLPALLRLGSDHRRWRTAIAAVVGRRGPWLARQNPDWQWLLGLTEALQDHDNSTTHTEAQFWEMPAHVREVWFARLRAARPAEARALLQRHWSQESAANRRTLLEKFVEGLSAEDLPWLESCLQDRSRWVRETAIDLCARLPQAALVQRMQALLPTCVQVSKGLLRKDKMEVIPITQPDSQMEQDGLDPAATQQDGLGPQAQWLRDIISAVDLQWLCAHYALSPEDWLKLQSHTEWHAALCAGLCRAAIRQASTPWLLALLSHKHRDVTLPRPSLFNVLPSSHREQWLLAQTDSEAPAKSLRIVYEFLTAVPAWSWSPEFSTAMLTLWQQASVLSGQGYEFTQRILPEVQKWLEQHACLSLLHSAEPSLVQTLLPAWQYRQALAAAFATPTSSAT